MEYPEDLELDAHVYRENVGILRAFIDSPAYRVLEELGSTAVGAMIEDLVENDKLDDKARTLLRGEIRGYRRFIEIIKSTVDLFDERVRLAKIEEQS